MHKHWLVAFVVGSFGVGSGCGTVDRQPGGPTQLEGISPSGAVMGQKGKIRVFFSNPLGADIDVALSSGSPEIATVPDHVTVPAGAVSADAEYTAVSPGLAVFEATSGDETVTSTANVVDMLRLQTA